MSNHIAAAVSAVIGREHVADIATYNVSEEGEKSIWVEVVYRDLDAGPSFEMLRDVMDNVGDVSCAADPRAVVSFIDEADMMAIAAE